MISVGIDVSKGKSIVCIMKPGGEVLKTPFEMQHTMQEILSLVTLIKSYDEEVKVIMESTGYYHLPIVTVLIEKEIFVSTVNALRMQKFCSQNIRRAKTDRIDSINIAMFKACHILKRRNSGEVISKDNPKFLTICDFVV